MSGNWPARRGLAWGKVCVLAAALAMLGPCRALAAEKPQFTSGGHMRTRVGGKTVALPLAHTDVEADVAAMVASVKVTQRFHNPYRKPIEAVYVFPLPHRAAVYAMKIKLGKRTIRGVVKRRAAAREAYRRARARGKTAALLEQERPNIFTQSVANIMPGERIDVEIQYVEEMVPESGRYSFVFPMVVGPRYVGGGSPAHHGAKRGQGWASDTQRVPDASRITPRLLARGLRPGHDIGLRVRIDGGVAVQHLQVVTHRATVQRDGRKVTVQLDARDAIPNKDFVLRYQLAGARPEVALLSHRDARGGHFLLTIQPKARMKKKEIALREYVFVVDNSGSMYGFPLQQARRVVSRSLKALRPSDRFQIIKFAGMPDRFSPTSVPATQANIAAGVSYVSAMRGGGGTEFLPALQLALRAPKDPARARVVLFITDGYIGYERQVLSYLRRHGKKSNIFALGIGSSVNRYLIDGMARIGSGQPFYLLNQEKAASVVERIRSTISRPALTSIRIDWGGLDVRDVAPAAIPDLFADRPVYLVGRYRRGGQATITVRGRLAGASFVKQLPVVLPQKGAASSSGSNRAVAYLWARQQIASWIDLHDTDADQRAKAKKHVTDLALRYNLISRFTSMVAIDHRVRNRDGKAQTVGVPLPLPAGVSHRAAPAAAYRSGVLGVIKGGHGYGRGQAKGGSYGLGGLGLRGTGRGGGGTGSGTIGLGSLGTIGKGGGGGHGQGYGRGSGRLRGRRAHIPRVAAGRAVVRGSLDRQIIRRIIRRHINQVRYCYQRVLQADPSLNGRVVVRFVIAPTGRVIAAKVSSTTLNNRQVETCLIGAVRRWLFPKPAGGSTVVVSYPFVFQPARRRTR